MSRKNFLSYEDSTTVFDKIGKKLSKLLDAYVIRGSVSFANLPSTLTVAMKGYVYNVSNDFITDSRFIEGPDKKYSAGTNVVVINNGTTQQPDMKFDVIGSFVDVDAILDRIDSLQANIADEFDEELSYNIDDIVRYEGKFYKFNAAHVADSPWDIQEVDEMTIGQMIDQAEPDSLTQEQLASLLALLD